MFESEWTGGLLWWVYKNSMKLSMYGRQLQKTTWQLVDLIKDSKLGVRL